MGADPSLLQLSLRTESDDMRYLTGSEMKQYKVTSSDLQAVMPPSPPTPIVQPPIEPQIVETPTDQPLEDWVPLPTWRPDPPVVTVLEVRSPPEVGASPNLSSIEYAPFACAAEISASSSARQIRDLSGSFPNAAAWLNLKTKRFGFYIPSRSWSIYFDASRECR